MKKMTYNKKTLTGGGPDALDGIAASVLNIGDTAFIEETQSSYVLIDWDKWQETGTDYILRPD